MDVPSWFQVWLDAAWYEKIFWLFMVGVPLFIAVTFIRILIEMIGIERTPVGGGQRTPSSGGIGFTDSYSPSLDATHDSSDSAVEMADTGSDSGGSDSGGGDLSGGGGDYGGGGSGGSWS
ncbi:MAG TPA: hypothetical protein VNI54_16935 [Thermoanaerobaculia bacterium]|nr:hypothetical protein [Thermoanaerobaculia bacterium]